MHGIPVVIILAVVAVVGYLIYSHFKNKGNPPAAGVTSGSAPISKGAGGGGVSRPPKPIGPPIHPPAPVSGGVGGKLPVQTTAR